MDTVERILDAAARIFDECGYRATTTNHVAEAARVSIGSLYQYFPNKDALLVALAERHVEEAADRFAERLLALRLAAPPLPVTVSSLLDLTVELNDTSRLHAVIFEECPRTPALTEQLGRLTDVIVTEVAWHLERTGAGGADPALRARLLVAAVDAAVHEVVLDAPRGPARAATIAELAEVVLHGVGGMVTRRVV